MANNLDNNIESQVKLCRKCSQFLNASSFSKNKTTRDGLQSYCKLCSRLSVAKWSAANSDAKRRHTKTYLAHNRERLKEIRRERVSADPEKARLKSSLYCSKNRGKRTAKHKEWVKNNPDKVQAWNDDNRDVLKDQARKWKSKNPEKVKSAKKKWDDRNKGYYSLKAAERRILEITQTVYMSNTHIALMKAIYKKAKIISAQTGIKHHVDHVIPLKAKNVCGLHVPWNLQILDWRSNVSKGNRVDLDSIVPLQPQSD